MTYRDLAPLSCPTAPWLLWTACSRSEFTDLASNLQNEAIANGAVRRLRGTRMKRVASLFDEIASALQFPSYFGNNWNALDECLNDLDWLPGDSYVLLIEDALQVLVEEPEGEFQVFLNLLVRTCEEWAARRLEGHPWDRPPTPFHVVMHCLPTEEVVLVKKIEATANKISPLQVEQ